MGTTEHGYQHSAIGAVHEVVVVDPAASALQAALAHERDICHAARVVVDLTSLADLTDEHVRMLSETVLPRDERWTIRISAHTPSATIDRLCDGGLDGHLITDEGAGLPTHAERRRG